MFGTALFLTERIGVVAIGVEVLVLGDRSQSLPAILGQNGRERPVRAETRRAGRVCGRGRLLGVTVGTLI